MAGCPASIDATLLLPTRPLSVFGSTHEELVGCVRGWGGRVVTVERRHLTLPRGNVDTRGRRSA